MHFTLQPYIDQLPSQQNVGCCTSSAALLAAEIILSAAGKKQRLSRLFVYYMSRKLKNRVGQEGAELRDTLAVMMQYGAATHNTWPFAHNRVNKEPPIAALNEAAQYRVGSYSPAPATEFKNYLHQGIPIIIGLHTGKLFWKIKGPLKEQYYKPINNVDNRNYKGHAVTIIGYDDSLLNGSWIVGNSIGLTWGDHGIGLLPYECIGDIGEAYVITEFAGIAPAKNF